MMMEMIEEAWDYIFGSLTPLLWINLFALSLSYWRDNNKDMDARLRHERHAESQHHSCYNAKRRLMRRQYQRLQSTFKLPSPSFPTRIVSRMASYCLPADACQSEPLESAKTYVKPTLNKCHNLLSVSNVIKDICHLIIDNDKLQHSSQLFRAIGLMMMGFRGSQFGPVMNAMVSCRYL
jgi:hypothetical protein